MALTFDEAAHEYRLDGVLVPNVSKILELRFGPMPDLPWIQAAADRGRKAHLACELWDLGDLDEESIAGTDLAGYVAGWAKWCGKREWALIEWPLAGTVEGVTYAGTIDRAGRVGLVDIKSKGKSGKVPVRGSDEWARIGLQLAGYSGLLGPAEWAMPDLRQAVFLWPDGHVQPLDYTPWNEVFDAEWRELLGQWKRQNGAEENDNGCSYGEA